MAKQQIHAFFYYKNTLYKNIEAEIGWNFKNILRICPASPTYTQNHFFLFHLYIFFTWWIHRSVELFARSQNHFSAFNEYIAVLFNCNTEIGWEIKNILRIYKAGLAGNVKNTEPRPKFPYSYKKSVYFVIVYGIFISIFSFLLHTSIHLVYFPAPRPNTKNVSNASLNYDTLHFRPQNWEHFLHLKCLYGKHGRLFQHTGVEACLDACFIWNLNLPLFCFLF